MLGLLRPTDPSWVASVEEDLPALLADHAHCELKAAQSALSLAGRWAGEHPELVEPLVELAKEETDHFRDVQAHAAARGIRVGPPEPDAYVQSLVDAAKPEHPEVPILLDRLLVAALIEARSCERFKLLSEGLRDEELRSFYAELMRSEARHHRLFTDLAERIFGAERTRARLSVLAEREAVIVGCLSSTRAAVHG